MSKLIDGIAAVAFDLDGTLIDTAPDLAAAANGMLATLGGRPLAEPQVPALIGAGIDEFVQRVLTLSGLAPDRPAAALMFRKLYGERLFERGRIYPGVVKTLRALRSDGRRLYCVTNKESGFTLALLQLAGLGYLFQAVFCADRPEDRKPSPNLLRAACAHADIEPAKLLLVGDSRADIGAAHAAGCRVVAVDYGYQRDLSLADPRPDAVVGHVEDLFELSARSHCHPWRATA